MTAAADRVRRHRLRRMQGIRVFTIEIEEFAVIDALIDYKFLKEQDSENIKLVSAAISKLISEISSKKLRISLK